jgi:adenylosuccinate synthase
MAQQIVVLSGSICVGKTTLTKGLTERYGARVIKTSELIDIEAQHRFVILKSRSDFQAFGELLNVETTGILGGARTIWNIF